MAVERFKGLLVMMYPNTHTDKHTNLLPSTVDAGNVDVRSPSVLFINDISKDPAYKSWPKGVQDVRELETCVRFFSFPPLLHARHNHETYRWPRSCTRGMFFFALARTRAGRILRTLRRPEPPARTIHVLPWSREHSAVPYAVCTCSLGSNITFLLTRPECVLFTATLCST